MKRTATSRAAVEASIASSIDCAADRRAGPWRMRPLALAVAGALGAGGPAWALPIGPQVVSGQLGVATPAAGRMDLTQGSAKAVVNWRGFGIAGGEAVRLQQPIGGQALFRVTGGDPSQILGQLSASGHLFLINPRGVLFGGQSRVDVGSLTASTLNLADGDFLAGRWRFAGDSRAGVVNQGSINAAPGGSIVLLGSQVGNSGSLTAPQGTVALGAGSAATFDVYGNGLVRLNVTGGADAARIEHSGRIVADGGVASLAARGAGSTPAAINLDGVVRAQSLVDRNGAIYLSGGPQGEVNVRGTLDASGTAPSTRGGSIEVTGDGVTLSGTARLGASGPAGGGTLLVGGDWQGANPALANARRTRVDAGAVLAADATLAGDGGKVVLWSDDGTRFAGAISARGGALGGNGGQVETSGKAWLDASGSVDASAPAGAAGQWLLDPTDVTIGTTTSGITQTGGVFNPQNTPSATINVVSINTALNAGTSVAVNTSSPSTGTGNITVAAAISKTAGAGNATQLTLNAAGSITMTTGSIAVSGVGTGRLGVNLNAGTTVSVSSISTASGNVSIVAPGGVTPGTIDTGAAGNLTINTSAGSINRNTGSGSLAVGGALNITASGFVDFTNMSRVSAGSLTVNAQGLDSGAPVVVSGLTTITAASNGLIQFRDAGSSFGGTVNLTGLRGTLNTGSNLTLGTVSVLANDVNGNAGLRVAAGSGNINITGPVSLGAARVNISTTGNLRLGAAMSTTSANFFDQRAIQLSAGTFTNAAGASALSAPSGNWTVYLPTPAGSSFGGLLSNNAAVWNTQPGAALTVGGNRYAFARAPTIVIQPSSQTKTYGDVITPAALTFNNSAPNANLPDYGNVFTDYATLRVTGSVTPASSGYAGTAGVSGSPYAVTLGSLAGFTSNLAGYGFVAGPAQVTVTRRSITPLPAATTRTYGSANPTSIAGFTLSAGSLVNGDTIGSVAVTSLATVTSNVGSYNLQATGAGFAVGSAANYLVTPATLTNGLSVTQRPLTLTPTSQTRTYGDANPTSGGATAGAGQLVNGNTVASVSLSSPATGTSPVGTYSLTGSNAVFGIGLPTNYAITYAPNATGLSVTRRPLTLTPAAQSRAYGDPNPTSGGASAGAGQLVNGNTVASVALSSPATTASPVGLYNLTGSNAVFGNGLATNYLISYMPNATGLTVTQRPLTLTPDAQSRVYGDANPTSGGASAGAGQLVNGNTVASVALSSPATPTSFVGNYTLSASNALFASGIAANYAITYADRAGGLTLTQRPVTLQLQGNDSAPYGGGTITSGVTAPVAVAGSLAGSDRVNSYSFGYAVPPGGSPVGDYPIPLRNAILANAANANVTANYALTLLGTTFRVTPRPVTLTPVQVSRIYGDVNPATAGVTANSGFGVGLFGGDTVSQVSLASTATPASNVGLYTTSGSNAVFGTGLASNYAITYGSNANGLNVTPRPLTLTPDARSRVYGDANPARGPASLTAGNLVGTDALADVALSSTATAASFVGNYVLSAANALFASGSAANYAINYADRAGGLTVTQRPVTVTLQGSASRPYGGGTTTNALATPVATVGSLAASDSVISYSFSIAGPPAGSPVGNYPLPLLTVGLANSANANVTANYALTLLGAAFLVTPRPVTLTPVQVSRIYGNANPATAGVTANSGFGVGLFGGDTVSQVSLSSTATPASNVGLYTTSGSNAVFGTGLASNYAITYGSNANGLNVTPRGLTLTPDPVSRPYGDLNPAGGTASGNNLVNGDTVASVTLSTPATVTSNVGSYATTGSNAVFGTGLTSNYTISYAANAAGLNVTPRALTLRPVAVSRLYGDPNPASGTAVGDNLVNGDAVSGISLSSPATVASNVGSYSTTGSNAVFGSGLASNYAITYADNLAGLAITPRALTLTPDAISRIYGDATPASGTATASNLVNGDTVASVTLATPATVASNVGTYSTSGSNAVFGSGLASNYDITYTPNPSGLAITQRTLTLAPAAVSRLYGDADPAAGAAVVGGSLVNGDTVSSVTFSTAATAASDVGTYATTGSAAQFGSGLASNYAISFDTNPSGLQVTPRPVTLRPNVVTRLYGDPNPTTGSATGGPGGLVNGDTVTRVDLTTTAGTTSNVGSYLTSGTNAVFGSGLATNYLIDYADNPAGLRVDPRPLTVIPNAQSRVYGEANPLTAPALLTGGTLVGGDRLGRLSLTSTATPASRVGTYATRGANADFASGLATNYAITYAANPSGLAITQRPLTLTPDPQNRLYGEANPARGSANANPGGLVNGDTVASVALSSPATPASGVGAYDLRASEAVFGAGQAGNYAITYADAIGGLGLRRRPLVITALPGQGKPAGSPDPLLAFSISGGSLVGGDALAGALARAPGEAPGSYPIGQGSLTGGPNYALSVLGGEFVIAPSAARLTIDRAPALGEAATSASNLLAQLNTLPPTASGAESAGRAGGQCVLEQVLDRDRIGSSRLVSRGMRLPEGVVDSCR
jgi:filamentous hemagglutinin family protein